MGMAKEAMDAQSEQGWSYADAFVCQGCVDEPALQAAIAAQENPDDQCSFCGTSPAAPLDALLAAFVAGVRRLYDFARDELYWDGTEGGYQGDTVDTWDLVAEFGDLFVGDGLGEAIRDAIADETWVAKDWAVPAVADQLIKGWDRFCHQVKYETRYVMWRRPAARRPDPGEIDPARVLDAVGDLVDLHPELLTADIELATPVWRARPYDEACDVASGKELGTTPVPKSRTNRMSPAGIPMFYGALDPTTAIAEATQDTHKTHVTVGAFHVTGTAKALDLTRLKPVPSIFALDGDERGQWLFLHHFEKTLRAKPTHQDIDYVPTQIVTEYFLKIYDGGGFFDGILYGSDVQDGQTCIVLDVPNARCVDAPAARPDEPALQVVLDAATVATRPRDQAGPAAEDA